MISGGPMIRRVNPTNPPDPPFQVAEALFGEKTRAGDHDSVDESKLEEDDYPSMYFNKFFEADHPEQYLTDFRAHTYRNRDGVGISDTREWLSAPIAGDPVINPKDGKPVNMAEKWEFLRHVLLRGNIDASKQEPLELRNVDLLLGTGQWLIENVFPAPDKLSKLGPPQPLRDFVVGEVLNQFAWTKERWVEMSTAEKAGFQDRKKFEFSRILDVVGSSSGGKDNLREEYCTMSEQSLLHWQDVYETFGWHVDVAIALKGFEMLGKRVDEDRVANIIEQLAQRRRQNEKAEAIEREAAYKALMQEEKLAEEKKKHAQRKRDEKERKRRERLQKEAKAKRLEHDEAERRRHEEEEEEEQRLQTDEQARATAPAVACGTPPVAADEDDAYEAALARRRAELEQDWKEQMSQEDEQLKAAQAASLAEAAEVAAAEAAAAASAEMEAKESAAASAEIEAEAAAPSPAEAGAEESVPASAEAVAEESVPATAPAAAVTPTEPAGGDPNPSKAQATNALLALLFQEQANDIGCAEASRRGDENPPKDAKDTLPDAGANSGTDTHGCDVPAPASARAKPQMCEAPTCGLAKDADSAGLVSNDETEHAAATAAAHESMAEEQFQRELQEALEASMTEQ